MVNYSKKIDEIVETAEQRIRDAKPENRARHAVAWAEYLQSTAQQMLDTAKPEDQEIISSTWDAGAARIRAAGAGAA